MGIPWLTAINAAEAQIQSLTQALELQEARLRRLTVIAVASAAGAVAALIVALAA